MTSQLHRFFWLREQSCESKSLTLFSFGICVNLPQAHFCGLNHQMVWPGSMQAQCRNGNRQNRDVLKLTLKIWLQKWMTHNTSHLFSFGTSWFLILAIPWSHVKRASNQILSKMSSLCMVVLMFAFTKQQNMALISPKLTYVFHFMPCPSWLWRRPLSTFLNLCRTAAYIFIPTI